MTPAQTRNEIESLINTLFSLSIAIDSTVPLSLTSHGETFITWSNDVQLADTFSDHPLLAEYVTLLANRWFSFVLADGAMFQLSYTFKGTSLIKHRLCYYPCPISIEGLVDDDLALPDLFRIISDAELRERIRMVTPVRFDYDVKAATKDHAASHLTFLRSTCRVPVSYPLSVGHFLRFVLTHFYPEYLALSKDLAGWSCDTRDTCLPKLEHHSMYIDWKRPP